MRNGWLRLLGAFAMVFVAIIGFGVSSATPVEKEDPIVVGAPIPRASNYWQNGERGMILATEEINVAGGVKVGETLRPFKLEIIDTRDEEPGFWQATDGKCAYSIVTLSETGNVPTRATPRAIEFYNAFRKRWQVSPRSTGCVSAYEAMYVLKDAIERAGSLKDDALIDGLYRTCDRFPHHTALVYLGESFTYRQLRQLIERFATALHDLGVRKDDRVMLYLPNTPQFLIAYLGTHLIGGVAVPVSPIHPPSEIRYLINDSGAKTILCMDTNYRYVREVFQETTLERIIVTIYVELLPLYKKTFGLLFDRVPHSRIEKSDTVYRFGELLKQYPPKPPKVAFDPAHQLCCILYTAGTTGFPKGCITTHAGMVSFIDQPRTSGVVQC